LVAFTIATILLAALLRGFSGGVSSSKRTQTYAEALIIAESTIEAFQTGGALAGGDDERDDGRFRVTTSIRRYGTASAEGQYLVPYEMLVTVSWLEGPRRQSIALRSLRLAPQP
jgi:type II secretory pathway pseudopilin PulG